MTLDQCQDARRQSEDGEQVTKVAPWPLTPAVAPYRGFLMTE